MGKGSQSPSGGGADTSALLALTKKLQDASAAYEKAKKEMGLLKKVCFSKNDSENLNKKVASFRHSC